MTAYEEIAMAGLCQTRDELKAILQTVVSKTSSWRIGERVPDRWLEEKERSNALIFDKVDGPDGSEAFESGCLFCDSFEIRWQPDLNGQTQIRYLGVPVANLDILSKLTLIPLGTVDRHDVSIAVWGRRVVPGGPFLNARLPFPRRYPATKSTTRSMDVLVREIRNPKTGQTLLWRLCGVEEKE